MGPRRGGRYLLRVGHGEEVQGLGGVAYVQSPARPSCVHTTRAERVEQTREATYGSPRARGPLREATHAAHFAIMRGVSHGVASIQPTTCLPSARAWLTERAGRVGTPAAPACRLQTLSPRQGLAVVVAPPLLAFGS